MLHITIELKLRSVKELKSCWKKGKKKNRTKKKAREAFDILLQEKICSWWGIEAQLLLQH